MTRDEAIGRIKARFDKWALDDEDMKAPDKIYIEQKAVMYDLVNIEPCKPDDYEYVSKDALMEWLRKEYETASWYDEKMRHVTGCVGDTSSSGKAQAYKSVIDKLISM